MITWMQRHKKYLIVTIWISTIAFIGAGFVGWGQYSYGDKAGAVAKVGEIEITQGELQKGYSNLYSQYNKMFEGNFDEEKAKQFGLQKQALNQLTQQALILNLAAAYDLEVNDDEILAELKTQEYFFNKGVFNIEVYKQVLSRNNLTTKEYEEDLKKNLLIQKTLKLLPIKISDSESDVLNTIVSISDKISYKVLTQADVKVDTSDELVKNFWATQMTNFMNEVTYDIEYIKQANINKEYEQSKILAYYNDNKTHFKGSDGKILPLENVKDKVITELNQDATKKEALRTYISYKKNKLSQDIKINKTTISQSQNPYNKEILQKVSRLSTSLAYLKPVLVNNEYIIIKLKNTNAAKAKSYKEAKLEVLPLYISEKSKSKLLEMANTTVSSFTGATTDFITTVSLDKISGLSKEEAADFLAKLFISQKKNAYITLSSGKIVLYNILEQKMLNKENTNQSENLSKLKSDIFNKGLIKELQSRYKTEIFVKGL
ncbi:MAG: peptidylprolyl isomerase [Sulfurimonas sp.]